MLFEELSLFSFTSMYAQKRETYQPIEIERESCSLAKSSVSLTLDSRRCRRLFRLRAFESHRVFLPVAIHSNVITWQHFTFENLHRQRILNHTLNRSPQWPRAVRRVVSFSQQQLFRRWR